MPAARNAVDTAAETSSSSVGMIRDAAWKSWTCAPKALNTEATCTPVAPAPITRSEAGTLRSAQASLCVAHSSPPGT